MSDAKPFIQNPEGPAPAGEPAAAGALYDRTGADWLREQVAERVLLMQGPMGSVLMGQPGGEEVPAAYWNVADPQEVERLHWLYRMSGADIALTNTFQASAPALERDGVGAGVDRINREGVRLAKRAAAPCTLGSVGPCGLDWLIQDSPEYCRARDAYRQQARALLEAGAHGIVLETFTALRALEPALAGVGDVACGMPVLVSFAIDDDGNLLGDGQNIEAACLYVEHVPYCPVFAVGVNCCSLRAATSAVPRMRRATALPLMVRPNAGMPMRGEDGELTWHEDAAAFVRACSAWVRDGARIVGSCCGTTARTTAALSSLLV